MNIKSRITSVLKSNALGKNVTGIPSFDLSKLVLDSPLEFSLPSNLRLGHLVERIVAELIDSSSNYNLILKNIQLKENKITLGELDFIIEKTEIKQVTHVELAYKFYLFDPSISSEPINNWIGPNRNDSLVEKLEKLKVKQFTLLYHKAFRIQFPNIEVKEVSQALCLMASLFVPYQFQGGLGAEFQKAIKGFYMDFDTFLNVNKSSAGFYIPAKKQWGMEPSDNKIWLSFSEVKAFIVTHMNEEQAPLIWSKNKGKYQQFFVVWW